MNDKVSKLALASRIIVLVIQFLANLVIPDHNPDVFKSPRVSSDDVCVLDKFVEFFFGGLRRWDAEYFLHVAEHGYSYENTLAFYPLYPAVVRLLAKSVELVTDYPSFRYSALLFAILLNVYFFYRAANCLYELTLKIFKDSNKAWNVVILFCFNPAAIFFSAPYSEGLFCWLTFSLMLECCSQISLLKTTACLALSVLCRSNGLINLGFPVYFLVRRLILKKSAVQLLKLIIIAGVSLLPVTFYYFYAFQQFCNQTQVPHLQEVTEYAKERGYVLAGPREGNNSPWCDESFPFPYSYVQSHYWNVGFLRYYEFKQIPNFLLAAPVLLFVFIQSFRYLSSLLRFHLQFGFTSTIGTWKSIPFVLHALFLAAFCTFFVHIQVSTRLLASSAPALYWFAADFLPKTFDRIQWKSLDASVLYWFAGYFIVGTVLFSNFLPWT